MIYRFNLISDEVDDFKLEIQIDSDDTFLSLRNVILDAAGYTKDQMDSFIICDEEWNKEKEVTLTDMGADSDEDIWLMDETKISELIDDEGDRLMFVFDYLTNRAFFMELKECIFSKDIDAFDAEIDKAAATAAKNTDDYDADFYGSDEFNEDEFDSEGFEIE